MTDGIILHGSDSYNCVVERRPEAVVRRRPISNEATSPKQLSDFRQQRVYRPLDASMCKCRCPTQMQNISANTDVAEPVCGVFLVPFPCDGDACRYLPGVVEGMCCPASEIRLASRVRQGFELAPLASHHARAVHSAPTDRKRRVTAIVTTIPMTCAIPVFTNEVKSG